MTWTEPAFDALARLVGGRTGLVFGDDRRASVEVGIRRAMGRSGIADPGSYVNRLDSDEALLNDLLVELTIGETYFFREPAQFRFLRDVVLPEVRRRRGDDHPVRAWSAGCASGEEAYSLAMLLERERMPGRWQVLATDLSTTGLAKARAGTYGKWSLRGEGADWALAFLDEVGSRHEVRGPLRRRVRFAALNLAGDPGALPAAGAVEMDLILCRNVLIYFGPEAIRAVARRLHDALASGGWLFTASTDPPLGGLAPFEVVTTEMGVFYRRGHCVGEVTSSRPARIGSVEGRRAGRVHVGERAPLGGPTAARDGQADAVAKVRSLANGDAAVAERAAALAIARYPFSTELNYLRGVLLAEVGRLDEASEALRRVVYLDRSLAVAHFVLGSFRSRLGDREGARRAYRNAFELSASRPAGEVLALGDSDVAARLADAARAELSRLEGAGPGEGR